MLLSPGLHAENYLLIRSKSEIHAIDLTTLNTRVVMGGLEAGRAMEIDILDNKLYFANNNGLSRADGEDMCAEVIFQNISVSDMAIDWLKRRIFWVEYLKKRVFVSYLNVTERRVMINTTSYPYSIAVDPILRYVLFTWKMSRWWVIDVNHHILLYIDKINSKYFPIWLVVIR